jgi:uncharacterized protein
MKLSRYVRRFKREDEPDSLILFSARKGSIIQIPSSMFVQIESGRLSEEEEDLLDLGFLCEDPEAERRRCSDS